MPDARQPGDGPDVQALEAEIVRLNKIVQALMNRAESSTNAQGSDFGLFQTTIMLQDQVRLHTEELEATLRDRERSTSDSGASAPRDMQTLRRTASLHIQLLELVVQQKDVGELIDRVATLLDMPIILFDTRGHPVCCSRDAAGSPDLARRLWAAYSDSRGFPGPLGVAEDACGRIYYRDVPVRGHRGQHALDAVHHLSLIHI